jgi:hypothetical protein
MNSNSQHIGLRAIVIAVLLTPLNSYWVGYMESIKYSGHPTTYSLYFNVVFILLILTWLNALVRRFRPRAALTQAELLVIYFVLGIGSSLVGHDQAQVLLSVIGYPKYFARPGNQWEDTFFQYLPKRLLVWDDQSLRHVYLGGSSLWTKQHLLAWGIPLLWWGAFTFVLLFVMLCLCVMLRKQWTQNEKLSFPLVTLPLEMTDPSLKFYRNRLMWYAFLIPAVINTFNNLNLLYPNVPKFEMRTVDLQTYFTSPPWSAIGWTPVWFFPFAVGVGFLLPLDLLFSSWVFYWVWKAQRIIVASLGYNVGAGQPPYNAEQSFGAYAGIAVFIIWAARHHLKQVIVEGLGMRDKQTHPSSLISHPSSADEALSYRTALIGFVVGVVVLVLFSVAHGMQTAPAIAFFVAYLIISMTISRVRAEFGSPVHDLHFADPGYIMTQTLGTQAFSPHTLTMFSLFFWFNRAHRSHTMPVLLEGIVATGRVGASRRKLTVMLIIAIVLGLACAYWALLDRYFELGAGTGKVISGSQRGFGQQPFNRLKDWMASPKPPNYGAISFMTGGFLFTLFLYFIRTRIIGFPFHPVGYAISGTWSMELVWVSLFLAWLCKRTIFKYGSFKLYHQAVPFFLGLILGDFISGGIWNILGVAFDWPIYHFLG